MGDSSITQLFFLTPKGDKTYNSYETFYCVATESWIVEIGKDVKMCSDQKLHFFITTLNCEEKLNSVCFVNVRLGQVVTHAY